MKIIGVALGWDGKPHLCFEDGKILFGNADKILYPQYFKKGDFPTDPKTNEKLPIVKLWVCRSLNQFPLKLTFLSEKRSWITMKLEVKRVWDGKLDKYKSALDKYSANYYKKDGIHFATIEIEDTKQLFSLSKEIVYDLIISGYTGNRIVIYDDYVEWL